MKIILLLIYCLITLYSFGQEETYPKPTIYLTSKEVMNRLNSYYTDTLHEIYPQQINLKKNVTDSIKDKLLSLMQYKMPEEKLKTKIREYLLKIPFRREFAWQFSNGGIRDSIDNVSASQGRDFDSVYHHFYDSMEVNYSQELKASLSYVPIYNEIVLCAAKAQIKEAIPLIRKDMVKTKHLYDSATCVLALAIFGDSVCIKKIFKRHQEILHNPNFFLEDYEAMQLIKTKESINLLIDWLDTSITYRLYTENDNPNAPLRFVGGPVVTLFLGIIEDKQFKEDYRKTPKANYFRRYDDGESVSKEQILFVKNWLLLNKGKYELENL